MEKQATPSSGSKGNNGRTLVTPKNRKKSPGDALGSGKSQLPITLYFSPVGSSSDQSSQPYSPIACSSRLKRRTSVDSPQPNKRLRKPVSFSQKKNIAVVSSDDSSDEVFSDVKTNSKLHSPAVVPKSRLSLIKRRLYPVASSPIASSPSRPKKKQVPKSVPKLTQRRFRILSDSDSEDKVPMENSQSDPKPLKYEVPLSTQVAQVRRKRCPETSSQAIVITSSEDSDFELHNSKQSQSFLSQSLCRNDTQQSSQKSFFPQMNKVGHKKIAGSSVVDKILTETRTFPKKCSLEKSCSSTSLRSKDNCGAKTPVSNRRHTNVSSDSHQKASLELPPVNPDSTASEGSLCDDMMNAEGVFDDPDDDGTHVPLIPVQNGDVPSIYLENTIPNCLHGALDETYDPDMDKKQLNCETKHCSSRPVDHQGSIDSSGLQATIPHSPPPGHSIYNEETIDLEMNPEATVDLSSTVDLSDKPLTNSEQNAAASANGFETPSPACCQKGGIIEPSDDEDESIIMQNQSQNDAQVSKINRTSLGVIPLAELLDVSHISGSDNSDLSDIALSDDDLSMIGKSDLFSGSPDALATQVASLLVEESDESGAGMTSIMNSMVDASADFFSDVVSSFSASRCIEERDQLEGVRTSGKEDFCQDLSPTEGIVNIALEVAGLDRAAKYQNSVDAGSMLADKSDGHLQPCPPSLGVNGSNSVCDVPSVIPTDETVGGEASTPVKASLVLNEDNATATPQQSCITLAGAKENSMTDSCMNEPAPGHASTSMPGDEEHTDMTSITNEVSADIKIVCGTQSESIRKLHITQHLEKSLLQNPNRPLLLDTIITVCQSYAEHVLSQEPIKTFVFQYSDLPQTSKAALNGCLLELLEDSNRWLKYHEPSTGSIDNLVSSGIFEYLNKNDDLITKLNHLTFSEITEVLCKLGNSPSKTIETMRNIVLNKFSSAYTCERVKNEVSDLINRKFVKFTESALFCIKICLELFALPLNLTDKLYKTVDLVRFANGLIRDLSLNRVLLLPLKTSKMLVNPGGVLSDLSDLCRLKSAVFGSDLNDESIYFRVNDICSSIAVMDISAESDPSVKNRPTFKFLMTNYVHALDEQLKTLLYFNASDIEFGACIYLAILLKQSVTGFQHKAKWCRERMRHLSKLFDSANVFEEFSKILKEPVTPLQFIVRSEFVSNAIKIKKLGLSLDEKSHLTKLLRPINHKKTQLAHVPLNNYLNYYTVLTKKPKGKNFVLDRANIFEIYKSDFPCGVEDNGSLLLNAIFLTFWQAIYQNLVGMFVNKFQSSPLDWGSEEFFSKRVHSINNLASEMKKQGLPAVLKLIKTIFEQFFSHRCVVDWQLVAPNMSKMLSIVETLGLDRFLNISIYVLGKLDERVLGFPDMVLWNPESKTLKCLGLRKPADPLYPYQILWLEKLTDFDVDAEELHMTGYIPPEQFSQLK